MKKSGIVLLSCLIGGAVVAGVAIAVPAVNGWFKDANSKITSIVSSSSSEVTSSDSSPETSASTDDGIKNKIVVNFEDVESGGKTLVDDEATPASYQIKACQFLNGQTVGDSKIFSALISQGSVPYMQQAYRELDFGVGCLKLGSSSADGWIGVSLVESYKFNYVKITGRSFASQTNVTTESGVVATFKIDNSSLSVNDSDAKKFVVSTDTSKNSDIQDLEYKFSEDQSILKLKSSHRVMIHSITLGETL